MFRNVFHTSILLEIKISFTSKMFCSEETRVKEHQKYLKRKKTLNRANYLYKSTNNWT